MVMSICDVTTLQSANGVPSIAEDCLLDAFWQFAAGRRGTVWPGYFLATCPRPFACRTHTFFYYEPRIIWTLYFLMLPPSFHASIPNGRRMLLVSWLAMDIRGLWLLAFFLPKSFFFKSTLSSWIDIHLSSIFRLWFCGQMCRLSS